MDESKKQPPQKKSEIFYAETLTLMKDIDEDVFLMLADVGDIEAHAFTFTDPTEPYCAGCTSGCDGSSGCPGGGASTECC